MSIRIDRESGLITLHTAHTSYQMWADRLGVVHHLYYGPAVGDCDLRGLEYYSDCGFSPQPAGMDRQRDYSLDNLCQEYTGSGVGDYRIGCLRLAGPDGSRAADFRFVSAEAVPGKYALPGLPAACDNGGECETLRLKLKDAVNGLAVTLLYGVYEAADLITRAAVFANEGEGVIRLDKAASACLDLPFGQWELIHFQGRHCMERQPERAPLGHTIQTLRSARGASSHQHNPFAILAAPHTTEEAGECLGAMLVWSGNFKIECEVNQMQSTRLVAGVSDDDFSWTLEPGGQFAAPEVLFCYSEAGLGELSARYHRFLQHNIIRSVWRDKPRPILINNWEATYMDFDAQRILDIARQARELGVEMLVLDDGWFGQRSDDTSGLGDWQVNEAKLGCTLDTAREMYLGFYYAPGVVCEAIKTAIYAQCLLELAGAKPVPRYCEAHNDIVTCFDSGSAAALQGFCAGIQKNSPIDSFVTPEPADEPGYTDQVIMASGSFTEGSTIEISCDGPLRPPYTCYLQGGVNFTAGRAAVLNAVQNAFFAGGEA